MKIGMLFPDYGSQTVGMAKELYDHSRLIQEYFEEASSCLNSNLIKLCFAASDAELARIENAYTAIFLVSVSIAAFLREQGIISELIAGYGIGEFSAIAVAEGLSFPDGLYFLNKYAQFYQEALEAWKMSMIKVEGLKSLKLRRLCQLAHDSLNPVFVAAYNAPLEHLVGGNTNTLQLVSNGIRQAGGIISKDRIERGLHNELMESVVVPLKKYLTKIDFKDLKIPLIASVNGEIVQKSDLVRRRAIKQLHAPIEWEKVMKQMSEMDILIEIGPGTTLSNLIKKNYPNIRIYAINKLADIQELMEIVGKPPLTTEIHYEQS